MEEYKDPKVKLFRSLHRKWGEQTLGAGQNIKSWQGPASSNFLEGCLFQHILMSYLSQKDKKKDDVTTLKRSCHLTNQQKGYPD